MAEMSYCDHGGCRYRTEDPVAAAIHESGHRVDDVRDDLQVQINAVAEQVSPLATLSDSVAALPGAIARHFHAAIENLEASPGHLPEAMAHAEEDDCPACKSFKASYDGKLLEQFEAERAAAAAAAAQEAKRGEPPKPAPVVARIFEMDDLDHFGVGAYGMEAVLDDDTGMYTIKVKPGTDNAELAAEAVAEGRVLPANCVLRVGADGKTTYVCDPAA